MVFQKIEEYVYVYICVCVCVCGKARQMTITKKTFNKTAQTHKHNFEYRGQANVFRWLTSEVICRQKHDYVMTNILVYSCSLEARDSYISHIIARRSVLVIQICVELNKPLII